MSVGISVMSVVIIFTPDHHAYARPRCEARTHADAQRPWPATALRARPSNGALGLATPASTRVVNW
eukprot:6196643-Pleurochrysis_carterae.AAC.2